MLELRLAPLRDVPLLPKLRPVAHGRNTAPLLTRNKRPRRQVIRHGDGRRAAAASRTHLRWLSTTRKQPVTDNKLLEFIDRCATDQYKNPEWRKGQAYFNSLYDFDPKLADEIRGTELDPFYNDQIITKFLEYILERWLYEN